MVDDSSFRSFIVTMINFHFLHLFTFHQYRFYFLLGLFVAFAIDEVVVEEPDSFVRIKSNPMEFQQLKSSVFFFLALTI